MASVRDRRLSREAFRILHRSSSQAKSGHENLRSLQRYARPSAEAVAAMTAVHDPGRRRSR